MILGDERSGHVWESEFSLTGENVVMIEDGKEIPKDKVLRSSCLLHIQTASFFGADKHYPLNDTPVLAFLEQGLLPGSERVKFQLQPSLQDFFLLL